VDPITISGLIATGVVVALLSKAHGTRPTVPRIGRWQRPPTVVLDPLTGVDARQVRAAMSWWQKRGYAFGALMEGSGEHLPSCILIRTGYPPKGKVGVEHLDITPDGLFRGVVVELEPGIKRKAVREALRHALGHALGYVHAETRIMPGVVAQPKGHAMHPAGGNDDRGLSPDDPVDLERLARERTLWGTK